jgi:hypothetical protein
VVIQSLTAGRWAKILGVTAGTSQGLLIFGASQFSRALAKTLKANGVTVLLADNNWDNIRLARMENLAVYFGNPASEHAENHMNMSGIGRVLVLSPYRQLNPLVSFYFQDVFGREKVYGLNNNDSTSSSNSARHQLSESYLRQLCLFGDAVSYSKLASLMAKGASIKSTSLTANFDYSMFMAQYGQSAIPLVYLQGGKVKVISAADTVALTSGVELISLIPRDAKPAAIVNITQP